MPEFTFNGPDGRLQGHYHPGRGDNAPIALLLHPHPQHGGTMNNRVVFEIFQVFARRGFSALRFNFRGVGRSQGSYDEGLGELSDAAAALDWLQANNPDAEQCWIAGFSFGAWICMQLLMRRPEITGFVTMAPPANLYDFSFLAPCPVSGLVIQGAADAVALEPDVAKLAQKLSSQRNVEVNYTVIPGADHFFTDKLDVVAATIDGYVAPRPAGPGATET